MAFKSFPVSTAHVMDADAQHAKMVERYIAEPLRKALYLADCRVIEAVNRGDYPNMTGQSLPLTVPTFEEWKGL